MIIIIIKSSPGLHGIVRYPICVIKGRGWSLYGMKFPGKVSRVIEITAASPLTKNLIASSAKHLMDWIIKLFSLRCRCGRSSMTS